MPGQHDVEQRPARSGRRAPGAGRPRPSPRRSARGRDRPACRTARCGSPLRPRRRGSAASPSIAASVGVSPRELNAVVAARGAFYHPFTERILPFARLTSQTRGHGRIDRAAPTKGETMEMQSSAERSTTLHHRRRVGAGDGAGWCGRARQGHAAAAARCAEHGPAHFAAPTGGPVSFTGTLDRTAVLRGTDGLARMELVIAARRATPLAQRRACPTDLVVILDRSGSMGGEKIEHARAAVRELVAQLGAAGPLRAGDLLGRRRARRSRSPPPTTARARRWIAARRSDRADGGTNMSSGLDLGLDVDRARPRPPDACRTSSSSPTASPTRATRATRA